jgi:DNA-binding transcriptional LysR family regulator
VAPLVASFLDANPEVSISLDLADRLADVVNEGIDLAVRIGMLDDSNLVGIRLAANQRVIVASPQYLATHGTPLAPADLARHECLTFGNYGNQARGWQLLVDGEPQWIRVSGSLACNDGAVLHDWALAGRGLAWRSLWEVGEDLRAGRLCSVLDDFAAPDNAIYAVFAQRRLLPLRVRAFVDYLKNTYANPTYWRQVH